MNSPASGWHPDPTARHEYRYWDGAQWTDDVSDGGVTSTDPVAGGTPAQGVAGGTPAQGVDPTAQYQPTQQFQGGPGPQPNPYGGSGQFPPSAGPTSPYGAPGSGPYPPATPPKSGPSTGLIAGLVLVAVALIGGITYFLVKDDGDDAADNTEISDTGDATGDTTGDTSSDTTADAGSGDDQIVEMMADAMEGAAGGAITHDQAVCLAEGMVDEIGIEEMANMGSSGDNPFADPELTSNLFDIMADCGIDDELLQVPG
jgi:hypothetical protein